MKKILNVGSCILLLAFGGLAWQFAQTKNDRAKLNQQVMGLEHQYAATKSAADIDTTAWKRFCDPVTGFCFKYPPNWEFSGGQPDEFGYLRVTVTSPSKAVTIAYVSPYVKDGSVLSSHIVSVLSKKVDDTQLAVVGSYPVTSGIYLPEYAMLNDRPSIHVDDPGDVGFTNTGSVFSMGEKGPLTVLRGYYSGPQMTSSAQAKAWFDSIDGKTAKAALGSLEIL